MERQFELQFHDNQLSDPFSDIANFDRTLLDQPTDFLSEEIVRIENLIAMHRRSSDLDSAEELAQYVTVLHRVLAHKNKVQQ